MWTCHEATYNSVPQDPSVDNKSGLHDCCGVSGCLNDSL